MVGVQYFRAVCFPQFLLFIVYPFWSAIFFSFSSAFLSLLIRALFFFFLQISGPESLCHVSLGSCCFCCLHFLVLGRSTSAWAPGIGEMNFLFLLMFMIVFFLLWSAFMIHFGVDLVGHDGRRDPLWALDNGWDVFDAFVQPTLRRRRRSIQLVTRIANAQWLYRLPTQGKNINKSSHSGSYIPGNVMKKGEKVDV